MCVWLKSFACSYPRFLGLLNEVCVLSAFVEDYFCQFIGTCRLPILFHWSMCLFLCQYRIVINSSYPQGILV